jgi:hypothetical protein
MRRSHRSRLRVESLEDRLAPATFTVTNINDAGAGSLRAAVTAANATAAADTIAFNIPGGGVHTLKPQSPLPAITAKVNIDGGTQPGVSTSPLIEVRGVNAGLDTNGLTINASAAGSQVRFLTINYFSGNGIAIRAGNCIVASCFIGTDAAGTSTDPEGTGTAGNRRNGISIFAGADNNLVGGAAPGASNLISNNASAGVRIGGTGTTSNRLMNNAIGRVFGGRAAVPNGLGVWITNGASRNTVGGTVGNIISGNRSAGIAITGPTTTGNRVANNSIGTDDTGLIALPNQSDGVFLGAGAKSTVLDGNVISGNAGSGVAISGAGTTNNVLRGNTIGLAVDGNTPLANALDGVRIDGGAQDNTVGSTSATDANVISGNARNGIAIGDPGTSGNRLIGNLIGTDATGTLDRGNNLSGVYILDGAKSNKIGGTAAGWRNLISGNNRAGVEMSGSGTSANTVAGNFIGTQKNGTAALGNLTGVLIGGSATANTIGGPSNEARNVISGNGTGIRIAIADANQVQGNFIGLDMTGHAVLGNSGDGVAIETCDDNIIGDTALGNPNVISGNGGCGVRITGISRENTIARNFIGTDVAGNVDLGNGLDGVILSAGASSNTVGGTTAGARNVISGNGRNGILIDGFDPSGITTAGNVIVGNYIGLNAKGLAPIGNDRHGVFITNTSALLNKVGGTTPGSRNAIANNGGAGVLIGNDPSQGFTTNPFDFSANSVLGNTIGNNGGLGIDLGTFGIVTANDLNDSDTGPNKLMNFPVLTTAQLDGQVLYIAGTINTETNTTVRIEFFVNQSADGSGHGEGQFYLGFVSIQMGSANTVPFSFAAAPPLLPLDPGQFITATATEGLGNTSEFSQAIVVA